LLKLINSIIDRDNVLPVPLKISAISIAQTFFPGEECVVKLDSEIDKLFQQELSRIEREKRSSTEWSQMFLHSQENSFLYNVLHMGMGFTKLKELHPRLLAEALRRSPDRITRALSEWEEFTEELYTARNHTVPEYLQDLESLSKRPPSTLFGRIRQSLKETFTRLGIFFGRPWS
jgi:hypothetical protein